MKTEQKLKNLTEEQKQKIVKEVNTELTSIAQEEKRTGVTIPVPKEDRLVALASASLLNMRKTANALMPTMSKKQLIRAVNAILDLPTDGVPVFLKTEEEKKLFAVGQRAISDRYVIITHHIKNAIAEDRINKLKEQETNQSSEGQVNVEATKG